MNNKTSAEWRDIYNIRIFKATGWELSKGGDIYSFYKEKINRIEFERRLLDSKWKKGLKDK